ncbi:hypothetical protein J3E68DRAFT_440200 [Trichoderma sp. SZMC 28012]
MLLWPYSVLRIRPPAAPLAIPGAQYGPSPAQPVRTLGLYLHGHTLHARTAAQTGKWAERGLGDRGSQAGGFKELLDQSASHC